MISIGAFVVFFLLWTTVAFWNFRGFFPDFIRLIGFPGSNRNYLVVFQDNNELRPTGGFIPFYGVIKFRHGIYTGFSIRSSFGKIAEKQNFDMPSSVADLIGDKTYGFRDVNINPDFTVSVADLKSSFEDSFPSLPLDGVVAVNFRAMESLLALVDSIKVRGQEVTPQNFFSIISQNLSEEQSAGIDKTIGSDFVHALIRKTIVFVWNYGVVADVVREALDEKDIMVHFKNSLLAKKISGNKWDGQLIFPEAGDFVAWNMANFGGLKSDRYISRRVSYSVNVERTLEEAFTMRATLEVRLFHMGEVPYKGILKSYIPLESRIISKDADTEDTYRNAHVFSKVIKLNPGQGMTIRYSYQLPDGIANTDAYSLFVSKQPGTRDDFVVFLNTPKEFLIASTDFDVREHVALAQTKLISDTHFSASFFTNPNPPLLTDTALQGTDTIVLSFDRAIRAEDAIEGLNYQIRDLNTGTPALTDQVFVKAIDYQDDRITLYLGGMSEQPNESYELVLKNLRDRNGIFTEPDPLVVTLAQGHGYFDDIGGPQE